MEDDKYVVFKREDYEATVQRERDAQAQRGGYNTIAALGAPLDDAVVIRTHDSFATSGLYGYAHTIQTSLELAGTSLTPEVRHALEVSRDYFYTRAQEAEQFLRSGRSKLPD